MSENSVKVFEVTDEDLANMRRGYSLDEVCRFHREFGGVVCNQRRVQKGECEKCGWNPKVERRRIRKVQKWLEEVGPWE